MHVLAEILEMGMILCFGISWPLSVYRSYKSRSTKGKSVVFIIAIIIGYVSGIAGKIISNQVNYVLIAYCFNLVVVSIDLCMYFVNKHNENRMMTANA